MMPTKHPFFILLIMISFAAVNAVMITPAMPAISEYFHISHHKAQHIMLWFLGSYAIAQLLYSPIENHVGRKPALYIGISLQIISNLICILGGILHHYYILIIGRILLGLGSGACLLITFTMVNEFYSKSEAAKKTSHLVMSFALLPELSMVLTGILSHHFGWMSCFFANAIYGLILLVLTTKLPETLPHHEQQPFSLRMTLQRYKEQFRDKTLITGAIQLGLANTASYIFATITPFLAISLLGFNSAQYGIAMLFPSYGIKMGSIASAKLTDMYGNKKTVTIGLTIALLGVIVMFINTWRHLSALESIFLPIMVVFFGMTAVYANGAIIAMSSTTDKAHGSAVMNFINLSIATAVVFALSHIKASLYLLPITLLILCSLIYLSTWEKKT